MPSRRQRSIGFPRFHFPAEPANASRVWVGTRLQAIAVAVSLAVLIAGRFAVAPVHDAATLQGIPEVYLDRPDAYVDFAPFSDVLDTITLLSERQHVAVLLGLVGIWGLCRFARPGSMRQGWRENMRSFAALVASIAVAYAVAAYLPRPMAYLESLDPDVLRIDFHSHTQSSRDARPTYSVERNRAWHQAGGYDVAYVTDHDTFAGAERGLANEPPKGKDGVILLSGIEVSWKGEHVGLLGNEQMSRRELSANLHDVDLRDPATVGRPGDRAPLMVWNHPRHLRLETLPLARGSVHAIEIANGALHGMDLVRWKRQPIIALARQYNLALLSGTDSHGWGYAVPNWTLLRIEGWRRLDRDELAVRIERAVRVGGFGATHVMERATADPGSSAAALALSVLLVPWHMLTALSSDERLMWLVWAWAIVGIELALRYRSAPGRGVAASFAR
jgi:predicted metal-dependent phosphoesterase TrpH